MSSDLGILLIRVLFGVPMAAHGAQKLFGWFGGYGLKGTGGFFEGLIGGDPESWTQSRPSSLRNRRGAVSELC